MSTTYSWRSRALEGRDKSPTAAIIDSQSARTRSAGVQDCDGAALILDRITRSFPFIERFFADAGFQGPRVAEAAPRPVEIIKRTDAGFVVQPKRGVIERTYAWACINRYLARDVQRAAATARALFHTGPRHVKRRT